MGLLDTLYSDCKGYLDLRAIQKGKDTRQAFYLLHDAQGITSFIKEHRGWNLFFGVATRDGAAGKKANIVSIPAVWVDVDFKHVDESVVGPLIAALPFQPTCKVQSGGGLHLYWKLREPSGLADMPRIESMNRALTMQLQGDMTATEAARILRIPNTHNYKYVPAREVLLVYQNGSSYNLCDLEEIYPYFGEDQVVVESSVTDKHQQQLERIMGCRFMQHCRDDAESLVESDWYAMITRLVREPGGRQLIHQLSKPYRKEGKRYSRVETDKKILQALDGPGPQKCSHIKNMVWDCEMDCQVGSPAALAFRMSYGASGASGATSATNADDAAWCKHGASMVQANEISNLTEKTQPDSQFQVKNPILSDSDKVRKWLEMSDGVFHYTEVARDLQINLHILRNILARFARDEKTIERVGTKSGTYQKIEKNFVRTELFKTQGDEFEVLLPLGLSNLVKLYPGSLVVIAGDSNAAKTALLLEVARLNLHDQMIRYINSEMPDDELNARLMKFAPVMDLDLWHRVEFGRIPKNYHHHVLRDCITIIDFIDIHEEFYRIGEILKSIHENIGSGLCFVSLQKSRGSLLGKGGNITLEKSRLYVATDFVTPPDSAPYNRARIEKCKGFRDDSVNPNGMVRNFNVSKWVFISPIDEWHYGNKQERIQPRTN